MEVNNNVFNLSEYSSKNALSYIVIGILSNLFNVTQGCSNADLIVYLYEEFFFNNLLIKCFPISDMRQSLE